MLASNDLDSFANFSRRKAIVGFSACCFLLICLSGCGGTSKTAEVTGSVEYKGKAVFPGKVLLRSESGKGLSANLNGDGEFKIFGVEQGETYSVAIEAIKLSGIGASSQKPASAEDDESSEEPRRREDKIPEKFQKANIGFPKKYSSFDRSGLSIDCSTTIPNEPQVFVLK